MPEEPVAPTPATGEVAPEEKPAEAKPTETVEFWKQQARENEKRAKANAGAATRLAELEESQKTDTEKLNDALTAAKADGALSANGLLKLEVALENAPDHLTAKQVAKFAKRLSGSTREEIEADAAEMFAELPAPAEPGARRPQPTPAQGQTPTSKEDPDAWLREMARK